MKLNFRFAIIGDPHIGLSHTIWDHPARFHLIEVSIPALEHVCQHLSQLELDFLLLPGDLTQHGERENHLWLADRLSQLPFPVYVIPGNHDVPHLHEDEVRIGFHQFPGYYPKCGYDRGDRLYYSVQILPGVRLIGLNSNYFDAHGHQHGIIDSVQLAWLEQEFNQVQEELVLVMIHHNVIEHLPDQARHPLGKRYMLSNANQLLPLLKQANVPLILTGHLHVQDIARSDNIYEITTGSLVSYPHPYRICHFNQDATGHRTLQVESPRIHAVQGWPDLQHTSREWMGDRSEAFMLRMLTGEPLNIPAEQAKPFVPFLRYFWADIANGDAQFSFPEFPSQLQRYFERFNSIDAAGNPMAIDNHVTLHLN